MDAHRSLIDAVCDGRVEEVRQFICSRGLSSLPTGSGGYDLLREALHNSQIAVAKLLISSGSKVNSKGLEPTDTPLHLAIGNGDVEVVEMLLNRGADVNAKNQYRGATPLHEAAEGQKMEVVELLLKRGANVDAVDKYGWRPLHDAAEKGNPFIVGSLLKNGASVNCELTSSWSKGTAPLHFAVESGNGEVVALLLSGGAHVDIKEQGGKTPLHIAAQRGYKRIAEQLLNHGASTQSVSMKEFYIHGYGSLRGYMPLHLASLLGHEEVVKLLLNRGADVNASTNDNSTPLRMAITREHKKVVSLLLEHGAKVDIQDKDGKTPLHLAVETGSPAIVEEVLKYCPDVNNESNRSSLKTAVLTALDIASERGHQQVVKVLLEYGAKVDSKMKSELQTLLHRAAENRQQQVVKLLLEYGVKVDSKIKMKRSYLKTPLRHQQVVKLLPEYGVKVDSKIKMKISCLKTPLHRAAENGYPDIIEVLLNFGADADAKDEYGRTALHIASNDEHTKVVETLLEYGADVNITTKRNQTPLELAIAGIDAFNDTYDSDMKCVSDHYDSDVDCYFDRGVSPCEGTAEVLEIHIVKMKTANLYVSKKNLLSLRYSQKLQYFQNNCEKELAIMKSKMMNDTNISVYDILAKPHSLPVYVRNENIVKVFKTGDYKKKFPIYASMIKSNFRKGMMERKDLLERGHGISHFLFANFPEVDDLPDECTEKIFSYLSNEDLRILIGVCEPRPLHQ